jgi:hypothetical protein
MEVKLPRPASAPKIQFSTARKQKETKEDTSTAVPVKDNVHTDVVVCSASHDGTMNQGDVAV